MNTHNIKLIETVFPMTKSKSLAEQWLALHTIVPADEYTALTALQEQFPRISTLNHLSVFASNVPDLPLPERLRSALQSATPAGAPSKPNNKPKPHDKPRQPDERQPQPP